MSSAPATPPDLEAPADRLVTLHPGVPKLTLAWGAVQWAMENLRQPNGPNAGKPWRPIGSQFRFLLWWYALDESGEWLFHHGVRRLAKGSGKSPFAAVLALMEFLGPVRLKDFDPKRDGGCVGRPVDMPLVQIAATAESQTANTMRMVRAMAPKGSKVALRYNLDVGKQTYYKSPEGTLQVITASSTAAEGAEASFIVADETEHWKPSNGGPDLASTLEDNLTKSGNRMLETCNAWMPGMQSVAEASWDGWVAQEEGRTRPGRRTLYDARIAPPDTDLTDETSLMAALEHVYDDCYWQNLNPIRGRIWDPKSSIDASKRKYMNWPTAAVDAWMTQQEWAALRDLDRVVDLGEDIVMFFDGSKSRDATALVGCCVSDGHVFTIGAWEPKPDHSGDPDKRWEVPVAEVDATVARAFRESNPLAFFADVKEWEGFVKVNWPQQYADQLELHAVPTGKEPHPIAWDMRTRTYDFTMAVELTETEIREQKFTHDGSAVLARHVTNARRRPNNWGTSIGKESPDSPLKIDAAVAMIGARMVRRLLLSSENRKKKRSGRWC
jgi:hypothetical protein